MNAPFPRRLLAISLPVRLSCMLGWVALSSALFAMPAEAGSFEVAASPSRFEISGKAGQRVGQSLDIYNVGAAATDVSVRTLDWTYTEDGNIGYHDELLPDSCRSWITLERRALTLPANAKKSFRFQIDIPTDAPRRECRFMLAIEGVEPAQQAVIQSNGSSLNLPVTGRIAVAIYLAVNGAKPVLEMTDVAMHEINGKRVPAVTVHNSGDAHGRLLGSLDAVDAKGLKFELVPEGTPILAGQTRTLPLVPKAGDDQKTPEVAFPIKTKGVLDWDVGGFKVDAEFK